MLFLTEYQTAKIRQLIEQTYNGTCTISEYKKVISEDGSTEFKEVVSVENQPCRLSFSSSPSTNGNSDSTAQSVVQTTKIFISPDINVKSGSKLVVTQNGVTKAYKNSGEPAIYATHQEIIVDLFNGWS